MQNSKERVWKTDFNYLKSRKLLFLYT